MIRSSKNQPSATGSSDKRQDCKVKAQAADKALDSDNDERSGSISKLLIVVVAVGSASLSYYGYCLTHAEAKTAGRHQRADSGGWRLPDRDTIRKLGTDRCNIDRVWAHELTENEFVSRYQFRRPVLLRFSEGCHGWTACNKWRKPELQKQHGRLSVGSGRSLSIVRDGGKGYEYSSFAEYTDELMEDRDHVDEPMYVFDRTFVAQSKLLEDMHLPSFLQPNTTVQDSFFFLGASKSGVSFHRHADAWNGVLFGLKRWFIYPPSQTPPGGMWPGFSQLNWLEHVYPKLTNEQVPLECVQRPGEILYLPESFYHATINIGDTVAVGVQWREARTAVEKLSYRLGNVWDSGTSRNDQELVRKLMLQRRIQILHDLLKILPNHTESLMGLGETLCDAGLTNGGLKILHKAVSLDPYFVHGYMKFARCLAAIGNINRALRVYDDTYRLSPNNTDLLLEYAGFIWDNASSDLKHMQVAVKALQKVLRVSHNRYAENMLIDGKRHVKKLKSLQG